MVDGERLQSTLDEVADSMEWAAGWIEYLEENEVRVGTSDLDVLKANVARLRVVSDAVLPARVRDPRSARRWYLAPDEAFQRERELEQALDEADGDVADAQRDVEQRRRKDDRDRERRKRSAEEHDRLSDQQRDKVKAFLRANGPSTAAEIASGTSLAAGTADATARTVAKRRRDGRFVLEGTGAEAEPADGSRE